MSAEKALPPPLSQYLRLPPELSFSVVTGVLGASTNWLVERFVIAALATRSRTEEDESDARSKNETTVLLVSWMRDRDTWGTEIRRSSVSLGNECAKPCVC